MLGNFQQSHIRIEVQAKEHTIRDSLLYPMKLRQWLSPLQLSPGLPEKLDTGVTFTSQLGFVSIQHEVELVNDYGVRFLLSQGIDGYHEWYWGDGWLQSCLEGISVLPLNLAQTINLLRLREYLRTQNQN